MKWASIRPQPSLTYTYMQVQEGLWGFANESTGRALIVANETLYFVVLLEIVGATTFVSATASVPSVEPKWEAAGRIYFVALPDDLQTSMMSVFATRMTEAVTAGKGVPCFHDTQVDIATSDNDAFDALYSEVQDCAENHGILVLSGGTVCTSAQYDAHNTVVDFLFRYPMFNYNAYTFAIDLKIALSKFGGLRQYGIGSTMTLIDD